MLEPGIEAHRGRFRVSKRISGVHYRRSFETLEEARQFLRKLLKLVEEERDKAIRQRTSRTIGDILVEWWEGPTDVLPERRRGHRDRVSLRTRGDYQYLIDGPISRIASDPARAYAEQPGLLKAYYDSFTQRVQVWRVHAILRQAFEYAVEQRWIDINPAAIKRYHPARVKRRRKTKLVPSREHVEKLLVAAYEQDESWGFFVYTLATLGLRCGEACAMHWEYFNFESLEVEIEWAVATPKTGCRELGRMFLKEPKVGESRTLPIGPEYFDRAASLRRDAGLVFPNPKSRKPIRSVRPAYGSCPPGLWHPNEATRRFRAMRSAVGLPAYTPHSLRHFVATQALIKMQGRSLNQVAEFLGHSPRMTLELYGWTLDREALQRVGETVVTLVDVDGLWRPSDTGNAMD